MIEHQYGLLERSPDPRVEWISLSGPTRGMTLDLVGLPPGTAKYHDASLEQFLPSVDAHFTKADIVIIDARYMTTPQKQTLRSHLHQKHTDNLDRAQVLGLDSGLLGRPARGQKRQTSSGSAHP